MDLQKTKNKNRDGTPVFIGFLWDWRKILSWTTTTVRWVPGVFWFMIRLVLDFRVSEKKGSDQTLRLSFDLLCQTHKSLTWVHSEVSGHKFLLHISTGDPVGDDTLSKPTNRGLTLSLSSSFDSLDSLTVPNSFLISVCKRITLRKILQKKTKGHSPNLISLRRTFSPLLWFNPRFMNLTPESDGDTLQSFHWKGETQSDGVDTSSLPDPTVDRTLRDCQARALEVELQIELPEILVVGRLVKSDRVWDSYTGLFHFS